MKLRLSLSAVLCTLLFAFGCGDDGGNADGDGGILVDGDGTPIDGDGTPIPPPIDFGDGGPISGGMACDPNAPIDPNATECNNCADDDEDGLIDGQDFECISPLDDDEGSFATGIPGDNKDFKNQDCFFDGDSGAGNDGCNVSVCCYLDGDCPVNNFDPNTDCEITQECKDLCGGITPAGCDCFGCCTLCNETGCYTVATNPTVSPECDESVLDDPTKCLPCTKIEGCGPTDCEQPDDCILCPGQDPATLPSTCNETPQCADGNTVCTTNDDCLNNEYCNQGCCNPGFIIQ